MEKFFGRVLQNTFKNQHLFNIFAFYTSYPKVTSKATMVYKNISKMVQNDPLMVQKRVQICKNLIFFWIFSLFDLTWPVHMRPGVTKAVLRCQKWLQSDPKVATKSSSYAKSDPKVIPKSASHDKSDVEVTSKWLQSYLHTSKVTPKWPKVIEVHSASATHKVYSARHKSIQLHISPFSYAYVHSATYKSIQLHISPFSYT